MSRQSDHRNRLQSIQTLALPDKIFKIKWLTVQENRKMGKMNKIKSLLKPFKKKNQMTILDLKKRSKVKNNIWI